ncbi:hypothetical protein [Neobacillus sp. D3-1R]|uniref:hypothetical protein n=1 Tax=Neobacillus sp. D3-1R TaxID=3445778 RepID=UPI003FA18D13
MVKKPHKLTISFSKKYEDVFLFLNTKENASKFICELIRKEMKNVVNEEDFEERVYKILLRYLENRNISLITDKVSPNSSFPNSRLKDEEVDLLNDLFG